MSHGQDSVSDTRREVTGRVHGISGRTTERHTQGDDDSRDRPCADSTEVSDFAYIVTYTDDHHQQHEGSDKLSEEVGSFMVDSRHGAISTEDSFLVFRDVEVVAIDEPYQDSAAEAANHLSYDIADNACCQRGCHTSVGQEGAEAA